MIRRLLCLFFAALLCLSSFSATAAEKEVPLALCYEFDLSFSLNADAFSPQARERASGYAELIGGLGLKGRLTLSPKKKSIDLDAALYYRDKPSLSYPFRLYGNRKRLFLTSPLINNEDLFLDMAGLMEFFVKAKNTLNIPLPFLAFLYPYSTEYAFKKLSASWNKRISHSRSTGTVTLDQFQTMSERWSYYISSNANLQRWIFALMSVSEAPGVIESEFANLPRYYEKVTGGQPLSVSVSGESETWEDASGRTLFSKQVSDDSFSLSLSLPASENGYIPELSVLASSAGDTSSFAVSASVTLDPSAPGVLYLESYEDYGPVTGSDDMTEYVEEVVEDDEDTEFVEGDDYLTAVVKPAQLLLCRAEGAGFPRSLPADSSFTSSVSILGAAYPNCSFVLNGSTKKDGAFSLAVSSAEEGAASTEYFSVSGTVVPAEPGEVHSYKHKSLKKVFNIFAMNDQSLADFANRILPLALKGLLSFVAEAPTAACQAVLDDLTDLGVLGMVLQ